MVAKIFIKRQFKPGHTPQIVALLNELRASAMRERGYISGETLTSEHTPNIMVVVATWQSMEDWRRWYDKGDRDKYDAMLELYQDGPTIYEEYHLGTPLSV